MSINPFAFQKVNSEHSVCFHSFSPLTRPTAECRDRHSLVVGECITRSSPCRARPGLIGVIDVERAATTHKRAKCRMIRTHLLAYKMYYIGGALSGIHTRSLLWVGGLVDEPKFLFLCLFPCAPNER